MTNASAFEPILNPPTNPVEALPVVPSDSTTAEVADLRDYANSMLSVLGHLGVESGAEGYLRFVATPTGAQNVKNRYGSYAGAMEDYKKTEADDARRDARESFTGTFRLGLAGTVVDYQEIKQAYQVFRHNYAGSDNSGRRKAFQASLKTLADIPGPAAQGDVYAIVPEALPPLAPRRLEVRLQPAATIKDLQTVYANSRTGFIAPTRPEMKEAIALLKRDDPLLNPRGIHDHLRKLADGESHQLAGRQSKPTALGVAPNRQVVRSRLFEYVDYMETAQASARALGELKVVVDANKDMFVTLDGLAQLNPELPGLPELLRYLDGVDLLKKGGAVAPFDPLLSRRNEDSNLLLVGQHKRTEDAYTGALQTDTEKDYVTERLKMLRAAGVRKHLRDAVENSRREENFWRAILGGVHYEFRHVANEVLQASTSR